MKKARRAAKPKAAFSKSRRGRASKLKVTERKKIPRSRSARGAARNTQRVTSRNQPMVVEPLSILRPETPREEVINDLPFSYNETKLILMPRDPFWAYAYWDFSADTWNWILVFRERDHGTKPKLRIHNVDKGTFEDRDIFLDARNWYLELGFPNTSYEVELGLLDSQGKFHLIAKSNRIRTPRNGPSGNRDHEWNLSEAEFAEIYRLSGGGKTGQGSEIFSSFRRR